MPRKRKTSVKSASSADGLQINRNIELIPKDKRIQSGTVEAVQQAKRKRFQRETDPLFMKMMESAEVTTSRGKTYLTIDPALHEAWKAKKAEIREALPNGEVEE